MKTMGLTILILLGIMIFCSCEKTKEVWICYEETYCANPWNYNDTIVSESEKVKIIKNYFLSQNIEIKDIQITSENPAQVCNACSCLSGNVIRCKVDEKEVDIMQKKGFYNCEAIQRLWVYYDETYCDDPWYSLNDSVVENQKAEIIKNYFLSQNIVIQNIEISIHNEPQLCSACSCLTGNRIRCEVYSKDLTIMQSKGFTKE